MAEQKAQQMTETDYMAEALRLAKEAAEAGEVPVGAVVVKDGTIIGRGRNRREESNRSLSHAEIEAIEEANQNLGSWRLVDCELYVTLEPCPMCSGAILQARINRLVYGTKDPKAGAVDSLYQLLADPRLNHQVEVVSGVLADEASLLLKEFFLKLRSSKNKPE